MWCATCMYVVCPTFSYEDNTKIRKTLSKLAARSLFVVQQAGTDSLQFDFGVQEKLFFHGAKCFAELHQQ